MLPGFLACCPPGRRPGGLEDALGGRDAGRPRVRLDGLALKQALADKAGIRRYGAMTLPMDEALVTAAIDLSGRSFCVWNADVPPELLGNFNAPLAEEFWRAVAGSGALNLHVVCHHGRNTHHIIEGVFKATARALRQAVELDPRATGIPSTKGIL
jgi:imidazoleglycerol-phosphate dehydratase